MAKFKEGDTISIEGVVKSIDYYDKVQLKTTGDPCCPVTLTTDQASRAVVVKAAVPARPAPGTAILHYKTKYITTTTDDLTRVSDIDGAVNEKYNKWSELDHDAVKILG